MNIEDIVCSKYQSRKFAELGLFCDSAFVWVRTQIGGEPELVSQRIFVSKKSICGPSPTAQELGDYIRSQGYDCIEFGAYWWLTGATKHPIFKLDETGNMSEVDARSAAIEKIKELDKGALKDE